MHAEPATAPSFVGRDRELALVVEALGRGSAVVLIEGEPGIGKTRLVQEALSAPPVNARHALVAGCPPLRDPFPLGAVVDAMHRQLPGISDLGLSPLAGALRPLFPEWSAVLPPAPEPLDDPRATRHRLFRALVELIEASDVDLLVVEDAHWADVATLELLVMLATADHRDIGIVVTYRSTDVPPGSPLLQLASRTFVGDRSRIALEPLTVGDTSRLVASMFGTEQVSVEFVSFLHERTQGIPLALEQTVSLLRERGDIVRRDKGWSRRAIDELLVPPTVRDSVLERVDRIGPAARSVLEAAAVLAEPSTAELLSAVTDLDHELSRAGLAAALTSGLLRESEPGRFACRHPLAARAIEEAMPASERRRLHARAAAALQTQEPAAVARLSRHFREANDVREWSTYAEAAARIALQSGQDRAAVVLLLDVVGSPDHPPDRRARLARILGEAATWGAAVLGELARAVVDALGAVLGHGDVPVPDRGEIRLMQGRLLLQLGEFEKAFGVIETAVDDLVDRPELAARAMISLAFPRGSAWPVARHLEWVDRATRMMSLAPSREHRTWLAVDRASALLFLGEESGWAAADEIDVDEPTLVEQRHIARGLMNVGHLAIVWGRDGEARRRLTAAADLMRTTGYQRLINSVSITLAHLDWHAGQWHGLAERLRAMPYSDDTLPEAGLEAALVLALLDLAAGLRERSRNGLESVLAGARQRGLTDVEYAPAAALGRLALADGSAGDAIEVTTAGIETIARKHMWVWATDIAVVHVEALVAIGDHTSADDLVDRFRSGLGHRDAPAARAALATVGGILTQARGDDRGAAAAFGEAARAWSRLPRPYDALLARERHGLCLLSAGDLENALSVLGTVQDGLLTLGADGDADRIARVLRQQGVDVARAWRGGRRGYGDSLSPRELDVVRLVARGMTNRAVAEALYISPRTVDRHLSSAMRKLDVASRTAVAMAAGELGLLGDGSGGPVSDTRPSNFG